MSNKNILIQCGDHFENQARIVTLAESLERQGFNPYILMYNNIHGNGNIFKTKSIKVIYLSNFLEKPKNELINFSSTIFGNLKVIDFINFEILRIPNLGWASKIKKTSNTVVAYVNALNNIISYIKPFYLVIWNGYTGYVANILRVLGQYKEIPMAFIERGLLKDSLFIDSKGVNGASSLIEIHDFKTELTKNYITVVQNIFQNKMNLDLWQVQKLPPSLKNKRIIFFPLQVQLDTNIILYSNFNTMREAFFEIYSNLNNENTYFIIRPHPEEDPTTLSNIPILDNVIISSDNDLSYWLYNSDIIVTINSTVGLEGLLIGKPVICLGKSIYSTLPCLSTYQNIFYDTKNILQNVKEYLAYLLVNNFIAHNNPGNSLVIDKIFGINNNLVSNKKLLLNKVNSEYLIKKAKYLIFCDFSFSTKMNLTYRKNSVLISVKWIESIIYKYIPNNAEVEFIKDKQKADIIITDKNFDKINIPNTKALWLDIYGVKLN